MVTAASSIDAVHEVGGATMDGMEVATEPRPLIGETVRLTIRDGDPVGVAFATLGRDSLTVVLGLQPRAVAGRTDVEELARGLERVARSLAVRTLAIETVDSLVRHHLRACGFDGGLRAPLRIELPNPNGLLGASDASVGVTRRDSSRVDNERAVVELAQPLEVTVRSRGLSALVGMARFTDFVATVDGSPTGTVTVRAPNRADLVPEAVARILDTAASVLRRFPAGVHRFWCRAWDTGHYAGAEMSDGGTVYLDPAYVLADAMEAARRAAVARHPDVSHDVDADTLEQLFVGVRRRYTDLEGTVAHELWHGLEQGVSRFGGIAFHRALGEALGVDTLEHALSGRAPDAPPEWRAAFARLVTEVSWYAATNPREAKAEMFRLWWRGDAEPTPIVRSFAELVEQELPPQRGG
jgi:hypothetical protein